MFSVLRALCVLSDEEAVPVSETFKESQETLFDGHARDRREDGDSAKAAFATCGADGRRQ